MTERRVTCTRQHRLFEITPDGIAISCRRTECRTVYVITWEEIEAKRLAVGSSWQKLAITKEEADAMWAWDSNQTDEENALRRHRMTALFILPT